MSYELYNLFVFVTLLRLLKVYCQNKYKYINKTQTHNTIKFNVNQFS